MGYRRECRGRRGAVVGRGGQERIDLEAKKFPFEGSGKGLIRELSGSSLLLQK